MDVVKDLVLDEKEIKWFNDLIGILYRKIGDFNTGINEVRLEVFSVPVGLIKALKRKKIERIEKHLKKSYSRFLLLEQIQRGDLFTKESIWLFLYNKKFEQLSTEKEKFGRDKFDAEKFVKYWVLNPNNMQLHTITAIENIKKDLNELNNLLAIKNVELNQLRTISISVISVFIALGSVVVSIFL